MPQSRGESCHAAIRPVRLGITLRIRALKRVISVRTIVIYKQVHLASILIIPVRRRTLDPGADIRIITARSCPRSRHAIRRVFNKHILEGLVFEETEDGVGIVGIGEDGQVDDIRGGVINVRLGRGKRLEIARVGGADLDVGWGARVSCVALIVEFGSPVDQVLA